MPLQDMPIRQKVMLVLLLTCGLVLALTCTAFISYEIYAMRKGMVQGYATRASIIAANSTAALAFQDESDAEDVLSALKTDPRIEAACLYDAQGNVFATYPPGKADRDFPAAAHGTDYRYTKSHLEVFSPVTQDGRPMGMAYIRTDLSALSSRYHAYALLSVIIFFSSLLVAFLLSRVFQKHISQPVLALAETARAISRDRDFSVRAPRLGRDELGLLTDAFNQMLVQIQAAQKDIRDLKTALDEHAIVAIMNPRGEILYVNDKFCALSGYTRDELLGQGEPVVNHVHQTKEMIDELWVTISHGQVWQGEIKNQSKNGAQYWLNTTIVPFLDDYRKPYQYVAICTDITTRKLAEAEINKLNTELEQRVHERTKQLEAVNQELEAFSYSVSHDLRAPLRHIDGFVDLLRQDSQQTMGPAGQRYLKIISEAAKRMGALIDDLLVFSRMGRMEMRRTTVSMDELVAETITEMAQDLEGRQVEWNITPLPGVYGDRAMLKQVWANLLSNAVKYSRQRSPARIKVQCLDTANGNWEFSVADNGAGFDMQYAAKLFGVFQRLHQAEEFEGTGVGLANVQRIVVRHGGRVWAEGKVDLGATFYFTLPKSVLEIQKP